jgi:hypothetical protein
VPHSTELGHPGDRRRIVIWAEANNVTLEIAQPLNSDLLILSNRANFSFWISKAKGPVILDLVDGYLGEKPSWVKDFLRNIVRSINGKSDFLDVTYTRSLKRACRRSDAIVVASPEQRECILPYNKNVYVILDDHSELNRKNTKRTIDGNKSIFWEGFGYTLKHFRAVSEDLDNYLVNNSYTLFLLTDKSFARWGGYLGKVDGSKLIKKWFPKSFNQIRLIPWSIDNVLEYSSRCEFAIIPIDTNDDFANHKPENKLLGLWVLGLPVLFSDTPAYKRVAKQAGLMDACISREQWHQALNNHLSLLNRSYMDSAKAYLERSHSKEILIEKWEHVINTTLSKSQSRDL